MKDYITKYIVSAILLIASSIGVYAQDEVGNPILTAVPSQLITPDAKSGGMADVGAATVPDVYSQHSNPAKYAFIENKAGVGASYTPWLNEIVDDVALMYASGYYKIGSNEDQAISASVRYFTFGDVPIHYFSGTFMQDVSPYEMSIDIAYSRKLTPTLSGAIVLRFINCDYSMPNTSSSTSNVFTADLAIYNESYINIGRSESLLGIGVNVSNIGSKMINDDSYSYGYLPTNIKLGASLLHPLDDKNTIALAVDLNKLLVPTPPIRSDENYEADYKKYLELNAFKGIFKSLGDAPGGFSEELKEISIAGGLEYTYNNQFKIRTGYSHENKMKGNRRYLTFGAGFRFDKFQIDASYLVSSASSNPLNKTLRCSVSFNL